MATDYITNTRASVAELRDRSELSPDAPIGTAPGLWYGTSAVSGASPTWARAALGSIYVQVNTAGGVAQMWQKVANNGATADWSAGINQLGVAGGQTIYGGTAANDDLTLEGTSHATKATSYVILQPTTGNVGVNTVTPVTPFHVVGAVTITGGIRPAADGTAALTLCNAAGTAVVTVDTTNGRVGVNAVPSTFLQIGASNGGSGVLPVNSLLWVSGATFDSPTVPSGRIDISMTANNPDYSVFFGIINADYGTTPPIAVLGTRNSTYDFPTLFVREEKIGILNSNPATRLDIAAGAMQFAEMTAPGAGAANTARIYAKDNGSGKTVLMVQFATGSEIQLAIEA